MEAELWALEDRVKQLETENEGFLQIVIQQTKNLESVTTVLESIVDILQMQAVLERVTV